MPTATAQKEEQRKKGLFIVLGVLGLVALLWIASALGWISGGSSFAGNGGSTLGASAGGGATAGNGGGGLGPAGGVGPSGPVNGGIGGDGSASTDNSGCFLGFTCFNGLVGAEGNQTSAKADDEGVDVDN